MDMLDFLLREIRSEGYAVSFMRMGEKVSAIVMKGDGKWMETSDTEERALLAVMTSLGWEWED